MIYIYISFLWVLKITARFLWVLRIFAFISHTTLEYLEIFVHLHQNSHDFLIIL